MLEMACTAGVLRNLSKGEAIQGAVIRGFAQKGVKAQSVPAPMLHELQKISAEVMAEQAARDADFKRVYESQEAFTKDYQTWKGLAYLPRDFNTTNGK
jgi:TRAP-type mannitol/chloroaromatic compound transport system substrate-binding protein